MSIGSRLYNLVRANLNALLDTVAGDAKVEDLTDEELEKELERRKDRKRREEETRQARATAERAARERGAQRQASQPGERQSGAGARSQKAPPRDSPRPGRDALAQLYAQLDTPYGADLATVKKSFRRLMRKYHPDLHAGDPVRQRAADDLSKKITRAYAELEQHLAPGRGSP